MLDIFTFCEISLRMLNSVEAIVEALGGTAETAALVGAGAPAISNWVKRRAIPPGNFMTVSEELHKRGLRADPAVFGFKTVSA